MHLRSRWIAAGALAIAAAIAVAPPAQAQVGAGRALRSENANRWPQYINTGRGHLLDYWTWHELKQQRAIHRPRSTQWEEEWYLRRNWSYDPSGRRYRAGEVKPAPATILLPRPSTLQGTGTRSQ